MANYKQSVKLVGDNRDLMRSIGGVTTALTGLVTAGALAGVAKITANFESLQTSLAAANGSLAAGRAEFDKIRALSTRTQFGIESLSSTFIKLRTNGIQPSEKLLRLFTDTAAASTDQIGTLNAITDLWARTIHGGLGLEDLNRLADRGIPVFDILATKLGITRLEISKLGKTAEGAKSIRDALASGLDERFAGSTEQLLNNLSTLFSNLVIGVKNFAFEMGTAAAPAFKEFLKAVTETIKESHGLARALGTAIGGAFKVLTPIVKFAGENINAIAGAMLFLATGAKTYIKSVIAAAIATKGFNVALLANPIGLVALAVSGLVAWFVGKHGLQVSLQLVGEALTLFGTGVKTAFTFVVDWFSRGMTALNNFGSTVKNLVMKAINPLLEGLKWVGDQAIYLYNKIAKIVPYMDEFEGSSKELALTLVEFTPIGFAAATAIDTISSAAETSTGIIDKFNAKVEKMKQINAEAAVGLDAFGGLGGSTKFKERGREDGPSNLAKTALTADGRDTLTAFLDTLRTEEQALKDSHHNKYLMLVDAYEHELITKKQFADMEILIAQEKEDAIQAIKDRAAEKEKRNLTAQVEYYKSQEYDKLNLTKLTEEQKKEFTIQAGFDTLQALAKHNESAFKVFKKLAIARAVINNAEAITKVFAQSGVAGIPLALGIAAKGLAEIATIKAQKAPTSRQFGGYNAPGSVIQWQEKDKEYLKIGPQGGQVVRGDQMQQQPIIFNFAPTINAIDSKSLMENLVPLQDAIGQMVSESGVFNK